MKLVYDIADKPPIKKNLIYAFQQLLAIMASTLLAREERDVLHVKLLLHGLFMGQLIVTELHGFSQDQLSGRLLYGAAVVEHL